ncbi:mitochondrial DNA helicase isoform X1 [Euwallacea similis]|uniref:mitochondrial DNA helicase isoform X1 n=2 Tax=Euwallacea similis TaxID=1736056 RepID=UPI00344BA8C4
MNFFKRANSLLARKRLSLQRPNVSTVEGIPEVSVPLIKKALTQSSLNIEEGFTCFITKCSICKQGKSEAKARLYVNKTTGMYMCSFCKHAGQWDELVGLLNLSKSKRLKLKEQIDSFPEVKTMSESLEKIRQSTKELKMFDGEELQTTLAKFKFPNLDISLLAALDIRSNEKNTLLYFPLENVENEVVGFRTLHCYSKEETIIPSINCGGILTAHSSRARDTAVLVPNVIDFLVLLKAKLSVHLVCLPDDVNALSQYYLPSFERFKKLVLWLGVDSKARDSARDFARKLDEKRCHLVRPNELLPHLNPNQDFKSIVANAQVLWHQSITSFSSLRSGVLSDLQNVDKVQGVKWKKFPTLNKIMLGHRRGELTVLTGSTGCGKTTFMSEYSLDLAMQGVNTLWGSFEIRNTRLARTMLQQMAGFPLAENLDKFDQVADVFEKLPIYFMTFHGPQKIKDVMEAVEHAAYAHDIVHVIIDNIQFMMGMSEEPKHMDRFWKQDAIIAAFRTFATRRNCHVTLVIHPRKEREDEDLTISSIFGSAKASQESDNIIIIQDKRLTSVKGKKYLQVVKNRYSGDLGVMPLVFDKKALSYAQKRAKERENNTPTVTDNNIEDVEDQKLE